MGYTGSTFIVKSAEVRTKAPIWLPVKNFLFPIPVHLKASLTQDSDNPPFGIIQKVSDDHSTQLFSFTIDNIFWDIEISVLGIPITSMAAFEWKAFGAVTGGKYEGDPIETGGRFDKLGLGIAHVKAASVKE